MRSSLFAVAAVAGLLVSALTPDETQAQVRAFPSINTSPYAHAGYYYPGYYSYPASYAYGFGYGYPGYFAWSNPYSTWGASWYLNNPYYYTGYGPIWYPW